MRHGDSNVIARNGMMMRVWVIERCNCEDLIYGTASMRSYDERMRREVLRQRGFDPHRPIEHERLGCGSVLYSQVIAL
jgi:hypothetical protein